MYSITKKITKYNQTNKPLKALGGIQHSTGNRHDTDEGNNNFFNTTQNGNNAHFFIDENSITQNVEIDKIANHARYPANGHMWGCEMCQTPNADEFKQIWDRQVWLWTYLFTEVAKPMITKIDKSILRSHHEENIINHNGEGHVDPDAYFAMFHKTMDDMRKDVQDSINKKLAIQEVIKLFRDEKDVSNWAKDSVKRMSDLGLIKGNDLGEFKPKNNITKEEFCVVLDRLLKMLGK